MSSIRRQLTATLCLAAAILLPAGGLAVYWTAENLLTDQFDTTLTAKAQALITAAEIDDDEFEIDFDVQAFAGFGQQSSEDYYQVRFANGESLQRSPSLQLSDLPAQPAALLSRGPHFADITLPDGRPGRAMWQTFVPADDDKKAYGTLTLAAASESVSLNHTLGILAGVLLVTGGVGLVATLLLLRLTLRHGLRPLDALATRVQDLRPDKPDQRIETSHLPGELQTVADKINDLLSRVQASLARERRFSSHAAHEMRTPLAELKAMTELMVQWPEESTPERWKETLTIVDEMEALLGKLSLLSRADSGGQSVIHEPVDLQQTVDACVERFQPAAEARGIHIEPSVHPGGQAFKTDPVLLQTVLNNLLGNAVSHAPTGARIHVEAAPGYLSVTNPAPELAQEDVGFLFDRFWRKNTGRQNGEHSGLGLSIVAACSSLMGARCEASLSPAKALKLEVKWS
ncbi:MAG TPA: ATP-binding protein [Prosthecobacter sp.]